MQSRRHAAWLAGIFCAVSASLFVGRQAVASWCNCPNTKSIHYEGSYSGITVTCAGSSTATVSGSGSNGPAGGGGTVSGGGSGNAVCWVSYTITDPHDVGGGGASEHTYTPKDGTYAITSYTGGGCIAHGVFSTYYTCVNNLIGNVNRYDNYPTKDCKPDPWTP